MINGLLMLLAMVLWVSLGVYIIYGTEFADNLADRFGIISIGIFWIMWNIPSFLLIGFGLVEVVGL